MIKAELPGSGSNPGDEDDPDDEARNKRRFLVDGRLGESQCVGGQAIERHAK